MEKIKYFIKEGFRSIWVNRMMSFASIIVLGICLIMLGTSVLVSYNIDSLMSQLESKNQIMVYIDKSAKQDVVAKVGESIKAIPNVNKSNFITREDNFNEAQKVLSNEKVLLTGIDSSAFDYAYQVEIKDISQYSATVSKLQQISGVKYVRQDEGFANTLSKISRAINLAGFWLFIVMAVISLFLISNTIKLAMYSRKREINIMKFVGATDWFIRWPFLIEGLIIGIIAGSAALLAQWYVYTGFIVRFMAVLNMQNPVEFGDELHIIVPGFLVAGVLVGMMGSAVSVRKYLKV